LKQKRALLSFEEIVAGRQLAIYRQTAFPAVEFWKRAVARAH
jgi:hypothetical protein